VKRSIAREVAQPRRMWRKKALASLLAVGSLALAATVPASASVPPGAGLPELGEFDCDGLGTIVVFGPAGGPVGFTTSGLRLMARSAEAEFTDPEGNVVTFSKTYGQMAGLAPFETCVLTGPDGYLVVSVAAIPPAS
jgi:hypothetical protein